MDSLVTRGINTNLRPSELENSLLALDNDLLANIRLLLFAEAKASGLVMDGSQPVLRKKTNGGKSVRQKHVADIALMVHSIKNNTPLPRMIMKNGKRSAERWLASQSQSTRSVDSTPVIQRDPVTPSPSASIQGDQYLIQGNRVPDFITPIQGDRATDTTLIQGDRATDITSIQGDRATDTTLTQRGQATSPTQGTEITVPPPVESLAFRSTTLRDIGTLKSTISTLKSELLDLRSTLNRLDNSINDMDCCFLYLRLKNVPGKVIDKALLESLINSSTISHELVRTTPTPAFRIKIHKSLLHNAISHARCNNCVADLWGGKSSRPIIQPRRRSVDATSTPPSSLLSIIITSWNCRGLSSGQPYIQQLIKGGSDVIVLSEHWLWPFDIHRLEEVHPDYHGLGKADPRLSDKSDSNSRGFGGVGVIWHKSLDVVPISNISSERICGIRIKTVGGGEESWLTVLGVYLPCLDLGIGLYSETLIELERAVTESCNMGSVVITGDFNAHLGNLWGPRAASNPNIQGILLGEAVNRCSLHAASLSEHVSGPCYTYHSGNKSTTVDYIFTDIEASSCIEKCWTHDGVDLNTSDHLPISALLRLTCSGKSQSESSHDWIRIDWSKAQKCGDIPTFQATLEERLKPFTNLTRSDVTQLDDEINQVAYIIKCTAEELLPRFKPKKKRSFADKVLTQICAKSKSTWKDWDKAGRPSSGPLYDSKCSLRADVRKRVKLCVAMNERKQVQRREHFFKTNAHHRFKLPQKERNPGPLTSGLMAHLFRNLLIFFKPGQLISRSLPKPKKPKKAHP